MRPSDGTIAPRRGAPVRAAWFAMVAGSFLGCASARPPPPEVAAREFAEAAQRGDADAIYQLMSREAQREFGSEGTRRRVEESRSELAEVGAALTRGALTVETRAVVRFADGERAELVVEDGEYHIELADALPTRASTPEAALAALRAALARRSYPAVFRLLSEETRAAIERDLDALVEGLADPETLEVEVDGDRATVTLPGGFRVGLRREDGVWRVEALD